MKIKDSNDMLGFLINHKDEKNEVRSDIIVDQCGLDYFSCDTLIQELRKKNYIIFSTNIIGISSLGFNNYVSPSMKLLRVVGKILIFTIKELVAFALGFVSGIGVVYVTTNLM